MSSSRALNSTTGSVNQSKARQSNNGLNSKQADLWADNIHLTNDHLDPEEPLILARHNKMLSHHDKFVEYIHHIENAKHQVLHNQIEEMRQLAAAGQKSNQRYHDLTYIVNENEEEIEMRDYTVSCKSTQPISLQHSQTSCIGSQNVLKQRNIKKIFPQTLIQSRDQLMASDQKALDSAVAIKSPRKLMLNEDSQTNLNPLAQSINFDGMNLTSEYQPKIPLSKEQQKQRLARQQDTNTTVEFMKILDFMQNQKDKKNDESNFKNNYRKKSIEPSKRQYKTSNFIQDRGITQVNLLSSSMAFRTMTAEAKAGYNQGSMSAVKSRSSFQRKQGKQLLGVSHSSFKYSNHQAAPNMLSAMTKQRATSHMQYANMPESEKKVNLPQMEKRHIPNFLTPNKRSKAYNDVYSVSASKKSYTSFTEGKIRGRDSNFLRSRQGSSSVMKNYDQLTYTDEYETPQTQMNSSTRLAAIINGQNLMHKASKIVRVEGTGMQRLVIPDVLLPRVPRHWATFYDDAVAELSTVTSKIYDGGVSKGLKHGAGQLIMPNGEIYKGSFKNDIRHGPGICKFNNGAIYKGEWRDGHPQGTGMLFSPPGELIETRFEEGSDGKSGTTWKIGDNTQVKILFTNGEYYEGNFKNNCRNGQGIHYYSNGDYYDGEWQNDRRIGRGRVFQKDGSKLNGLFIEDQADGQVEYEDKDGNVFQTEASSKKNNLQEDKKPRSKKSNVQLQEDTDSIQAGSFLNGRLYWLSVVNYKNGDKYRGNFKDGRACGQGTMNYNYSLPSMGGGDYEQAEYKGQWKAGKREGYGTITWTDGSQFKGLWKGDMRHEGEMYMQSGNIYIGSFQNDKMHGLGKLLLASGDIFEGNFDQDVVSSIGKILYPNGDIYFGQHKLFQREGCGKLISFDGSVYEGFWEQGNKNGQGRQVYENGDIYVGEYNDGKRSGRGRMYVAAKQEIYDGEWSNDRRQGEGTILDASGMIASGDFRADQMEGKLQYQQTLTKEKTERVFSLIINQRDAFITVDGKGHGALASQQKPVSRPKTELSMN